MATITVPDTSDKFAARDWREGLVELPADHVYGKTALTQQEWRQLAHKRTETYVVLYANPVMTRRVDSLPKRYDAALADFRYGLLIAARFYGPHSCLRLSFMAQAEWQRICKECRP